MINLAFLPGKCRLCKKAFVGDISGNIDTDYRSVVTISASEPAKLSRNRLKSVMGECRALLTALGFECVNCQGEAEAMCAQVKAKSDDPRWWCVESALTYLNLICNSLAEKDEQLDWPNSQTLMECCHTCAASKCLFFTMAYHLCQSYMSVTKKDGSRTISMRDDRKEGKETMNGLKYFQLKLVAWGVSMSIVDPFTAIPLVHKVLKEKLGERK